jgi:uncharacterized protein YjbI with pentapeptide repeats
MTTELISFSLGSDWITKLWGKLRSIQKERQRELDDINKIMFGNPLELAKYYVEPSCQEMNPADRDEEDHLVSHESAIKKIDQFFRSKTSSHLGKNQMFILGDAGMGKSALLTMLKLLHLTSFWPKDKGCVLKKLGPKTLDEIKQIQNQFKTILLLDSLDEDPCAYGKVKERLLEVLEATKQFHRVIITCRTQFFPTTRMDPFERPGLITIGGFICPSKYLSFFDDTQVEEYLRKHFPKKFGIWPQKRLQELSRTIIHSMGSLRCRPMLLAYIEDLMASPLLKSDSNEFVVYKALIDAWLLREEAKNKISSKLLFKASELLATELTLRQTRIISENELDVLIASMPEIEQLKKIDIKGRSLINRNSDGDFRFSHFSFQEFLVANRIMKDTYWEPSQPIPSTQSLLQFAFEAQKMAPRRSLPLRYFDLTGVTLTSIVIPGQDLRGVNLRGANLSDANLSDANLSEAKLQGAALENIDLSRANLSKADLSGASLVSANLTEADLSGANLGDADLSGAKLHGANLFFANLSGTKLLNADLAKANLAGTYLADKSKLQP